MAIPVLFIVSVFLFVSKDFLSIIFLIAIIVQILILSLYILFKINIITSKNLKGIGDAGIKQLRLTFSKKLLSYSIYSAILYSICIILIIIIIIIIKCYSEIPDGLNLITVIYTMILTIIIAFLIPYYAIPVLALTIAVEIVSVVIVIIMCLVVILSLNGTIRTIFLLPKVKEKWIFYILIMLVPLANVVYMLYLCKLINKELV
ncbi:hypothetical protein [Clostridium estertheticum]|uniref:hypothetical protein n=1 Tax=Clostridium estertheticum TaxID=238834 RepID=UPI001CF4BA2E|nr:hypothetical protein [Clostridium estertheticum]MCB2362133.1 hypothetical protein [Clostridium estertheticum]